MAASATDRIQQLLLDAAERLSQNEAQAVGLLRPDQSKPPVASLVKHAPYVRTSGAVAQLDKDRLSKSSRLPKADLSSHLAKQASNKNKDTAGPLWYDLPSTEKTPEVMREHRVLANRNAIDPHIHYKKDSRKGAIPHFSQIGTVIEGPTEFLNGRLTKKERQPTLAAGLLARERSSGKFNAKYQELQRASASGRDRHKRLKHKHKR